MPSSLAICSDVKCIIPLSLFNSFDIGDCENNNIYDDDFELYVDSFNVASNVLKSCDYFDTGTFKTKFQESLNNFNTSIYFQNIDGMKSNFDEFMLHFKSIDYNFDFICSFY